jgi:hypothetical protein
LRGAQEIKYCREGMKESWFGGRERARERERERMGIGVLGTRDVTLKRRDRVLGGLDILIPGYDLGSSLRQQVAHRPPDAAARACK